MVFIDPKFNSNTYIYNIYFHTYYKYIIILKINHQYEKWYIKIKRKLIIIIMKKKKKKNTIDKKINS